MRITLLCCAQYPSAVVRQHQGLRIELWTSFGITSQPEEAGTALGL